MKYLFRMWVCLVVMLGLQVGFGSDVVAQSMTMTLDGDVVLQPQDMDARTYYPVMDENDNLCALLKVIVTEELKNPLVLETGGLAVKKRQEQMNGEIWFWVPCQVRNLYFSCSEYKSMPPVPVCLQEGKVYRLTLRTDAEVQSFIDVVENFNFLKIQVPPEEEVGAVVSVVHNQRLDEKQTLEKRQLASKQAGPGGSTAADFGIEMVLVEGGTFQMGATSEQGSDAYDNEKPVHSVTLSDFYISKYEVTQGQWRAVMGSNLSNFTGDDNLPVEQVSWDEIQEFIEILNQLTGKTYRLPTEAEWEYAARGGNQSQGYKYAGSNAINEVAWYYGNWYYGNSGSKTNPVGQKQPNELGLYDMSGNVWEWCQDWYGYYTSSAQTNPTGPIRGSSRVLRGGGWNSRRCRVSIRGYSDPSNGDDDCGFRLVEGELPPQEDPELDPLEALAESMVLVEGGTFQMGATSEQGADAQENEKPVHSVTLSDFYIGKYEVTQAQWKAVMGENPSDYTGDDNRPVENVSWEDVQEFIQKLNAKTGKTYRLPTEVEWEYAARGGKKSQGYKYAGSNTVGDVAWYDRNTGYQTHPVGQKQLNELGLYDMSGNVLEWCQDWYGDYTSSAQINPTGPSRGSDRVLRGGSWNLSTWSCRVSYRFSTDPSYRSDYEGFRLVLLP